MSTWKISTLMESDLPELAELFREFWNEVSSLSQMRSTFKRISVNPAYNLLAARTDDDKLVGYAMGIICEELYGECRPFMVIEDLIVAQTARHQGIGTALVQVLEDRAKHCDCCQIILVTETNRREAVDFYNLRDYRSNGYQGFKKRL